MLAWLLDRIFDHELIRHGCAAGPGLDPVYMRRYFLIENTGKSRADSHVRPRLSLTHLRKTQGFQLYLHKICLSDEDRELHDHPWDFLSLILWRGYEEETFATARGGWCGLTARARKWPGMILRRTAQHRHRVLLRSGKPAWTLVVTSGKLKGWGFYDGRLAYTPWRDFFARKCGDRQ